jgi:hypothetical protein
MVWKKAPVSRSINSKIYCANCQHCKLVVSDDEEDFRRLRVRCAAGMWVTRGGAEKYYKYFTVARREREACTRYEPMGDPEDYLRELRRNLPIQDERYDPYTMKICEG